MQPKRLRAAVLLGAGLVLLGLALGTALLLHRTHDAARRAAETSLHQAASAAEVAINRQFLQVDGVLASLPVLLTASAGPHGPVGPEAVSRLLRGLNAQPFAFRDLVLIGPDGAPWASARPWPRGRAVPVGPEELRAASRPGAAAVAGPVRNPATGEWALFVARPVVLPGAGRLDAAAEVPLPLIGTSLAAAGRVPGLRVALERRDGRLLAGTAHDGARAGAGPGASSPAPVPAAPVPAMEATRATLYEDVFVAARLDLPDAMAAWTRDRDHLLAAGAAAAGLVVALAAALHAALLQRERMEAERARARITLDDAIECMSDGLVIWDARDRLVTCNESYRDFYRVSAPYIRPGARFEDIVRNGAARGQYPQAGADIEGFVRRTVAWHRSKADPIERLLPDGRWVLITERPMPDGGTVGIRTDITAFKRTQAELAAANDRVGRAMAELRGQNAALEERDRALRTQNVLFDAALNNMSHGLLMVGPAQTLIVCNARFLDLFGVSAAAAAPGTPVAEVFRALDAGGRWGDEAANRLLRRHGRLAAAGEAGVFSVAGPHDEAVAVAQRPLSGGGWVATYEDVTEGRRAEARVRFMAHHDALTGLPNRVLFRERLDEGLRGLAHGSDGGGSGGGSGGGGGLALLHLDLDGFKDVNDTLGHPVGDALLDAVGRRLRACVRGADVVARLGGDEFAVIHASADLPGAAERLGRRVIEMLGAPYDLAGRNVAVGVSVGIAVAPGAGTDADTLLKNADVALYRAKAEGRGTCRVFEAEMAATLHARLALEADLRGALAAGQFRLAYQPILDARTDAIAGFEALLRWTHPARGPVSPAQFIPVAEDLGLIDAIGAWVLQRACADAVRLPGGVKVAVNLSAVQLGGEGIVHTVAQALARSGLHPARLELEITETALLQDNERTVSVLHRLRSLGLRIALDDFGTGYSSLSYLRSFPFDKLKIDRSFVGEITARPDCLAIVEVVAALAGKLGITTTAEGVETVEQFDLVRRAGCTEAQGYLFGKAGPIEGIVSDFRVPSRLGPGPQARALAGPSPAVPGPSG